MLADPDHQAYKAFEAVTDAVEGACGFCAKAFHSEEGVRDAHVHLLNEYEGHPSIRRLVTDCYEIITF